MKIRNVYIKNFRGIKGGDAPIAFDDINVFVGDNGTCKTAILEAINYCLSPGYAASRFEISDFNNGTEERIEITVEFEKTFVAQLPDGFTTRNVQCDKVRLIAKKRERAAAGKAFSDLVTTEHYVVPVAPRDENGWLQKRQNGGDFKFTERQLSLSAVEAELPRPFYFSRTRNRQLAKGFNSSLETIINDLNWRFEKGQRDKKPDEHFKNDRATLHDKVLSETDGDTLKKTIDAANDTLKALGIDPISISLIKTLSPYDHSEVVFAFDGFELPVESCGSGIEMASALALLEAMARLSKQEILLLIDEPELHLHPKLQDKLFDHFKEMAKKIQIVVSTHSPLLFKNAFNQAGVKVQITRKEAGDIKVSDAGGLGFGKLKWSPSWGEICYLAYDLPTIEFHDDLYSSIEDKLRANPSDKVSQNDVENWLVGKGQKKEIKWQDPTRGPIEETLMTYVRNRIHHPDNAARPPFTPDQLRTSIERMTKLI